MSSLNLIKFILELEDLCNVCTVLTAQLSITQNTLKKWKAVNLLKMDNKLSPIFFLSEVKEICRESGNELLEWLFVRLKHVKLSLC